MDKCCNLAGSQTARMSNPRSGVFISEKKKKKLISQDKGQKEEVKRFIEAILNGTGEPIPFEEIYNTSLVTFKIIESIRTGTCIKI